MAHVVPDFPENVYGGTAQEQLTNEWLRAMFHFFATQAYHDNWRSSTGFWVLSKCAANAAMEQGLAAEIVPLVFDAEGKPNPGAGEVVVGASAGVTNHTPYLISNLEILRLIED